MVALDVARIEAGLPLIEVDYISAHHARIEAQKSSPFEMGLGWAVALESGSFIGQKALRAEKERGSPWAFVGLAIDWVDLEKLFNKVDLPPQVTGRASRIPVPLYKNGKQIGQITSSTFSPILKKYIGLGTVLCNHAALGSQVDIEITVEYSRERGQAAIVKTPFFDPAKKKKIEIEIAATTAITSIRVIFKDLSWHKIKTTQQNTMQSSSAAAITGLLPPLTWPKRARRRWCWKGVIWSVEPLSPKKFIPGFKYTVFSYVVSLLRPDIIRDLQLPQHGLTVLPLESTLDAAAKRRLFVPRRRSFPHAARYRPPFAPRRRSL